jgi:hypothetical protein
LGFFEGKKMRFWLTCKLDKLSIFIVHTIMKLIDKKSKYNKWLIALLSKLLKNVIALNIKLAKKEINKMASELQKS